MHIDSDTTFEGNTVDKNGLRFGGGGAVWLIDVTPDSNVEIDATFTDNIGKFEHSMFCASVPPLASLCSPSLLPFFPKTSRSCCKHVSRAFVSRFSLVPCLTPPPPSFLPALHLHAVVLSLHDPLQTRMALLRRIRIPPPPLSSPHPSLARAHTHTPLRKQQATHNTQDARTHRLTRPVHSITLARART